MTTVYPGNIPSNVGKDAKYSVVHGTSGMEVRLIYRIDRTERALLTTAKHPELVEMVNAVKVSTTQSPGGAFYINEFGHVLVPAASDGCVYAGSYSRYLEFDHGGEVLSPRPPAGLVPGKEWPGPHVGILYKITADGRDIRYEVRTSVSEKRYLLSAVAGPGAAAALAQRLSKYKGSGGGRIYINEAREFFAPVGEGPRYIYLGSLANDAWFPKPAVS
jgi:hypothetical protein